MARLKPVAIHRFKRIEQIEIPLGDVTLLIGANNSGKSSILQAIHFAVSIAQTARLIRRRARVASGHRALSNSAM
jgi:predicted ATP-dependent endonuclease of OLD family